MDLNVSLNFLSVLLGIASVWLAVAGIFDCVKSSCGDAAKIAWITFMICLPIAGPLVFLLLAGPQRSKQSLAESEAALKQRFNNLSRPSENPPRDPVA